ncbi:hypothetical protein OH77DRAFT_1241386 [Trametes cingulata]|nr:hypothetical protein OH77DRAFT_1241386 [Trametes cingulata]
MLYQSDVRGLAMQGWIVEHVFMSTSSAEDHANRDFSKVRGRRERRLTAHAVLAVVVIRLNAHAHCVVVYVHSVYGALWGVIRSSVLRRSRMLR